MACYPTAAILNHAGKSIGVLAVILTQTRKHGGGRQREDVDADAIVAPAPNVDLLALDAALQRLAERDPLKARLVKLRYFAGLSLQEVAKALGISAATTKRHWIYARSWLYGKVHGG